MARVRGRWRISYQLFVCYIIIFALAMALLAWGSYAIVVDTAREQGQSFQRITLNQFSHSLQLRMTNFGLLGDAARSALESLEGFEREPGPAAPTLGDGARSVLAQYAGQEVPGTRLMLFTDHPQLPADGAYILPLERVWEMTTPEQLAQRELVFYQREETDPFIYILTGSPHSSAAYPLVMAARFPVSALGQSGLAQEGVLVLANGQGRMFYVSDQGGLSLPAALGEDYAQWRAQAARNRGYYRVELQEPMTGWTICLEVSLAPVYAQTRDMRNYILVAGLIACGLLLITSLSIVRGFSRRISQLADNMRRIGSGSFHGAVEDLSPDEIGAVSRQVQRMGENLQQLQSSLDSGMRLQRDARLRFIYAQINSHFLYNTLSVMNWTAMRTQCYDLSDLIISLSDFYRLSLNRGRELVTFETELDIVRNYVQVEQINRGADFHLRIEAPEELYAYTMIKLTVQPLVENAVVHGLAPKGGEGSVRVKARIRGNRLVMQVIDSGVGMSRPELEQVLIDSRGGLHVLAERIRFYCGPQYGLRVESKAGVGTRVTVWMPYQPQLT